MKQFKVLLGLVLITFLNASEAKLKLRFPIANNDRSLISGLPIIGMDHDKLNGNDKTICENYRGAKAPFCYNNHRGTDFSLIGGFAVMDKGSAQVVAAAAGVVEKVVDGNYDRCAVDFRTMDVSCHGHPMKANYVTIKHQDGTKTRYLHLKKGSLLVQEGQKVKCGEPLGLVGSSGRSSLPHLHFEVIEKNNKQVDPYAGRNSQNYSYWIEAFMPDGLPSGKCAGRSPQPPRPAKCVWETIQDAGTCGSEVVRSAVTCGVETVTSALECGTQVVQCGVKTITSAAQCGVKTVTNAAQCGTDFLLDIPKCLARGLNIFNGGCNFPKSCNVAKTCSVPKYCNTAKTCQVAKSCELPRSCQVKVCSGRQTGQMRTFPNLDF